MAPPATLGKSRETWTSRYMRGRLRGKQKRCQSSTKERPPQSAMQRKPQEGKAAVRRGES